MHPHLLQRPLTLLPCRLLLCRCCIRFSLQM
jgi:hypothetical protein